jgi:hypothetical protein
MTHLLPSFTAVQKRNAMNSAPGMCLGFCTFGECSRFAAKLIAGRDGDAAIMIFDADVEDEETGLPANVGILPMDATHWTEGKAVPLFS